jgi:hypothetical protein
MRTGWVNPLILLIVGVVLALLAYLLPAPLNSVGYVVGIILAIVGGGLLLVALIRGAA